MPMKICQVGTGFTSIPPQISAATEEVVYYLSRELVSLACDVTVVDISDGKRRAAGLPIVEMPYFSFIKTTKSNSPGLIAKRLSFSFFSAAWLQRSKQNLDVIHFHNQFPAYMFQLVSRSSPKKVPPTVFTVHNPIWGLPDLELPKEVRLKFVLEIEAMKRAAIVIAVSEILKRNLIKRLGLKQSSIVVIPNGVNTALFHPNRATQSLREYLAPNGEKIILCVGRISRFKGQKTIVDAIPNIARENPSVRFVFVGPVDDAQYFKEISKTIRSLSLEKYCVFTGNVPSDFLPKYFATADVFVLPSITEGLPLTLLQAMSSGRAIVASAISQNKEVAKNDDEIVFVNQLNPEQLSDGIFQLLVDERKRERLGENARRTACRYFEWKVIAEQTLQLYEKLLER